VAPTEAMQFGRTLHRLLQKILMANPRFGPVYLAKYDLADGFYRIWLLPRDTPKLGVILPAGMGKEPLIAFPLALPMGWVHSPPYFCAATETVADLVNDSLGDPPAELPPHRLEKLADTVPPDEEEMQQPTVFLPTVPVPITIAPGNMEDAPLAYTDPYVDNFLALSQGNCNRRKQVQRVLLHTMDTVFRPLSPSDSPYRQEPISIKNLSREMAHGRPKKSSLDG
jgi:hypothetical protein